MKSNKENSAEELISNKGSWRRFGYVLVHANIPWVWIILIIAVSLGTSKLELMFPQYTAKLMNGDISYETVKMAIITSVVTILLVFANNITSAVGEVAITRNLRATTWKNILKNKPCDFGEAQPGELISRVTTDTQVIGTFLVNAVTVLIADVYYAYSSIKTLAGINTTLLYWMLACIPLSIIASVIWGRF